MPAAVLAAVPAAGAWHAAAVAAECGLSPGEALAARAGLHRHCSGGSCPWPLPLSMSPTQQRSLFTGALRRYVGTDGVYTLTSK